MVGYWLHEGVGKQEIGGVDGQTDVTGHAKRRQCNIYRTKNERQNTNASAKKIKKGAT